MAFHVRRQLREAVATRVNGLPTTGVRVYESRVYELQDAELPGLLVYTTGEEVVDESVSTLIGRAVQVVIEGKAKNLTGLDDQLDQISKEVEGALASALTLGGKPILLSYEGCDIEMEQSDRPTGTITMRFSALLYTQRSTPDIIG